MSHLPLPPGQSHTAQNHAGHYLLIKELLKALRTQEQTVSAEEISKNHGNEKHTASHTKKLADKKKLHQSTYFFIEKSWEHIGRKVFDESLGIIFEDPTLADTKNLAKYFNELRKRNPAFPWSWLRARMSERLFTELQLVVPLLAEQNPAEFKEYQKNLRRCGVYWFRETPLHHLKLGYHTALAVACKWYGEYFELCRQKEITPVPGFLREELKSYARFSMPFLHATDGWLWDSAGATPLSTCLDVDQQFLIEAHAVVLGSPKHKLEQVPLRLGCPALRSISSNPAGIVPSSSVLIEVVTWVEQVFTKYLI